MKLATLTELSEISIYPNHYNFSIEETPYNNEPYSVWGEISRDLVEWSCGVYDECLNTYIHIFNIEGKYIETYKLNPTVEDVEELKLMCYNWNN